LAIGTSIILHPPQEPRRDVSEYTLMFCEYTLMFCCLCYTQQEALHSLASEPGLHQMLPRFSTFISEGVSKILTHWDLSHSISLWVKEASFVTIIAVVLKIWRVKLLKDLLFIVFRLERFHL